MKITIDIPDSIADRVIEGIALRRHYEDKHHNNPNKPDKKQFFKDELIEEVKREVATAESQKAGEAASKAAFDKAMEDIKIT